MKTLKLTMTIAALALSSVICQAQPHEKHPNKNDKGAKLVEKLGLTEKQAKAQGLDIKVGKFPFSASGKASASGAKDGFVKVIFDAKYGEWLGCHMIGAGVTDMIAEAVLGRKLETTGHEVLKAIHPHPTMSEAVMEAVAAAYDEVIHL